MASADFTIKSGFTANDILQVNSTVDASSSITGAAMVVGGMGIGKKLYVGSGINTTTGTFTSTVSTTQLTATAAQGTAPLVVTSTTPVTNLTSNWVVTNANMTGPITGTGNVTSITSQTGTGTKFVVDTSPTLITPDIGVATATTVNKVTITAPATNSVLTIANGKTLTASNSITVAGTDSKTLTVTNSVAFSGTDSSTLAFRAGGQVAYTDKDKLSAFLATTSAELATVISDETGTGVLVFGTSPAFTTSITTGSTSFDLINTTATTVNFAKAATALSIGAATGTTTVNNNLQVTGDIYFNGTASKLSSTNIEVNDALVYFGANNVGDLLDLGWIGRYNNGVVTDAHVGFIRSASDKEWKLFSNVTAEPTTTVDLTSATYDNLRIGKLTTTGVNKVAITAPTTSATLTIADGATFATAGAFTTTITSTAATAVTLPTTGLLVNTAVTTLSSLAAVGTITSGTWSGSFGLVSGANLTSLTAGNLIGTIPSTVLGNSTLYIGTTSIALNRATASQTLSGISIDGNAGTVSNGVYTTGSYADPTWISSLAYSKITGTPSAYSLSISTASVLGGVKIGSGVNVDAAGVISVTSYSLPTSSTTVLGGVKVDGTSITITSGSISATSYSLPTSSTTVLGGVKVDGTTITINGSGVISGANTYALPATTTTTLGGVIIPAVGTSGLTNTTGTIGLATASTTQLGGVKVDNTTITISSGVISATAYSLPTASTSTLGGVKVDGTSISISGGTISTVVPTSVANISGGLATQIHYQTAPNTTGFITAASTGYLYYNGTAFSWATPAVGGGGTVTSVSGTGTVSGLTLTGTVTTTGNLTLGGTLAVTAANFASQTANTVLVAPNGAAGVPTFRALVAADIPVLSYASTSVATTLANGLMSSSDKSKLDGVAAGATANTGTVTGVTGTAPIVSSGGTAPAISIAAATTSVNGYLTSTDWNTFNGKQAALGFTPYNSTNPNGYTSNTGTVTGVTGTAPIVSSGGTAPAISIAAATTSVNGYLTSTDWTTFNGKQAALVSGTSIKTVNGTTLLGSGDLVITGGASATKTIANKIAAYTVVAGDLGTIINCTANTFTVSLTAAASLGSGFTCIIWNTSNTASNVITIDPAGTETIDGKTTLTLRRGEGLAVVCNGTNWETDDKKPMRVYAENINPDSSEARPVASADGAIAIGLGASSSGGAAISLGYSANATSFAATAIGANSGATGSQAVTGAGAMALGGSYASGVDSFAAGIASNTSSYGATGANSIAIGYQAIASGSNGKAIGNLATASDVGGLAISTGNGSFGATASGAYNIAIGRGVTVGPGQLSTGLGQGTVSSSYSVGIGFAYSVTADMGVALGAYADTGGIIGKISFGSANGYGGAALTGKTTLSAATTTTTAAVLTTNNSTAAATNQLIVATNQAMTFFGTLIAKQSASANMASYMIKGAIVNNGGTVTISTISIETIVDTIGLTTQPTFTADNTNKGLTVTSGAKLTTSIRWVCNLDSVEVTYA